MKTIIYFISLKIAEIGGAFLVYYLLCLGYSKWVGNIPFWFGGFFGIFVIAISICGLILFGGFLMVNWDWAKKITRNK